MFWTKAKKVTVVKSSLHVLSDCAALVVSVEYIQFTIEIHISVNQLSLYSMIQAAICEH